MNWQPMNTAPQTRRRVILATDGEQVMLMKWLLSSGKSYVNGVEQPRGMWKLFGECFIGGVYFRPTHWAEAPKLPKGE